jgi:hypothetical protein
MKSELFVFVLLSCIFCAPRMTALVIALVIRSHNLLVVLLTYAKAYIAYIAYTIFRWQAKSGYDNATSIAIPTICPKRTQLLRYPAGLLFYFVIVVSFNHK